MLRTFNFKAILSRWIAKKDEGALQKRSDFCTLWQFIQCMNDPIEMRSNDRGVCEVAFFKTHDMKSNKQIQSKIYREMKFLLALREKLQMCNDSNSHRFIAYSEMIKRQEGMIEMLKWVLKT